MMPIYTKPNLLNTAKNYMNKNNFKLAIGTSSKNIKLFLEKIGLK